MGASSSDWAAGHNSRARLIAGNGIVGVELQMPEGWKTYWRTPGEAGACRRRSIGRNRQISMPHRCSTRPQALQRQGGDTISYKGTVVFPVRLDR
jgi:DsbC/DsbD-like thiol-disulfide interchange protein